MKIFLFLCAFMLMSCGPVETQRIGLDESYVEESTGEPFLLKFDARSCDDSSLYTFKFFTQYTNFKTVEYIPTVTSDIFAISQSNRLKKKMLFGGKIINRISLNTRTGNISSKRIIKQKASTRELCLGKDYTESDTLDAVGVKVDATMSMIEIQLKETSLLRYLKPINIRIHPKYTNEEQIKSSHRVRTKARTLINNALFNYEYKEMVILPQGTNTNGIVPFNSIALWDIPLVTSHEYGHYVFSALYPNYFDYVAPYKISRAHLCYNPAGAHLHHENETDPVKKADGEDKKQEQEQETTNQINFELKPVVLENETAKRNESSTQEINKTKETNFTRNVDEHTIIGALNEGFADLFARYTMSDDYTVNGVGCLSRTRDVYSEYFLSGEKKILSKEIVTSFLSSINLKKESCYKEINTQSLHVIGAILAHGVDKLYTTLGLTKTEKLKELTKWIRSINRSHSYINELAKESILAYYVHLAFNNALKQYPESQNEIKELYELNFPEAHTKFPL